ncbi:MAG: redox-sensing transcriptional repressor Rex, partial [Clostridia bacterium]|nr:redox-sensing transcriptional repressor Rex [Clostridia bacterium]
MSKKERISKPVMKRLPRYLRFMSELMEKDIRRISSKELSQRMGLTASQIRQDFNCFGGFGQQGYGYDVDKLHTEMSRILGVNNSYGAVLVGAGNLGRAIATHVAFGKVGFELIGIFDKNP